MTKFAGNAMNTIPSTFNHNQVSTTIIGGLLNPNPTALNISVILLNSGNSHLRQQIFENLIICNFSSIISVERNTKNVGIDELSKKYPFVKFILPQEPATDGEIINIAMSEISSDYVLVIRDNVYIPSGIILSHLAERLTKSNIYCVVPRLTDKNKNSLACSYAPSAEHSKFVVYSSTLATDSSSTLYPFDYIALYNRKKFIQLEGFDSSITSPYWQNLDLSLRAWLWGEEIKLTTLLQFSYIDEPEIEDKTYNLDYLKFYLKNQLPKYKNDRAVLKKSHFLIFLFNSSCGFFEAKRQFKTAQKWVEKNKYRFKCDLQTLISNWRSNSK